MGGSKSSSSGSTFTAQDQLKMQQEMVNQAIRFEATKGGRSGVEAIIGSASGYSPPGVMALPELQTVNSLAPPPIASVLTPAALGSLPALQSLRAVAAAPGVSQPDDAPDLINYPSLFQPTYMPVRDKASFLAAKRVATKDASVRKGRASTILSKKYE